MLPGVSSDLSRSALAPPAPRAAGGDPAEFERDALLGAPLLVLAAAAVGAGFWRWRGGGGGVGGGPRGGARYEEVAAVEEDADRAASGDRPGEVHGRGPRGGGAAAGGGRMGDPGGGRW